MNQKIICCLTKNPKLFHAGFGKCFVFCVTIVFARALLQRQHMPVVWIGMHSTALSRSEGTLTIASGKIQSFLSPVLSFGFSSMNLVLRALTISAIICSLHRGRYIAGSSASRSKASHSDAGTRTQASNTAEYSFSCVKSLALCCNAFVELVFC